MEPKIAIANTAVPKTILRALMIEARGPCGPFVVGASVAAVLPVAGEGLAPTATLVVLGLALAAAGGGAVALVIALGILFLSGIFFLIILFCFPLYL